ncbi:zinc finger and BTB domain-containing protein 14-like isoform X8 [Palaemon carinicauda]|uniref:zinc finger and BTB domain-containing protein 14-like isoform X8 n=1 Tax=Palaemon carinicauda TaxID=392227 RepID=UPI0035B6081E
MMRTEYAMEEEMSLEGERINEVTVYIYSTTPAMESGLLSLKWNDHSHTFFDMLSTIRRKESYCDVTLVSDGRFYPVHKLVLSTCSEFFDNLFSRTDCKHPVVIIANVSHKEIEALLNYMYLGEVNVFQKELGNLMKAAEILKIKGLAEPTKGVKKDNNDKHFNSPSELLDSSTKRKRSEDSGAPSAKRSQCAERPGLKESEDLHTLTEKSKPSSILPTPSSSNTGASSDHKEPFTHTVFEQQSDVEEDSGEKAVRPEVKVEEIKVKDEDESWFDGNEESGANIPYCETDSNIEYDNQTIDYSNPCVAWEFPAATQPHLLESHLPQGMPGASGLQAEHFPIMKKTLQKKWRKLGDEERAMLLTLARANPKASSEKLRSLLAEFNIDISARTVRRELLDAGIKLPKQSTKS